MRQYSIQSILDWLEFKHLLKNRSHAEAAILCDLNSSSMITLLKKRIHPFSFTITCLSCIFVLFALDQLIPIKGQHLAFVFFTMTVFSVSLIPKKTLWLPPLLTGFFIAIGFESAYLTLIGKLQPIYNHISITNILLLSSLTLIAFWKLLSLKYDNNFTFSTKFSTLSLVFCTFLGLAHPTILIALLIAISGYKQTNFFLLGFGLCLTILNASWFIYNLDIAWNHKSILMMGLGLALLLVQSLINYFGWQDEG